MNPKQAKIERQIESSNQSRGSISKFTSRNQKSDEETDNEGRNDLSFQINFVDEDQHKESGSYNRRLHHSSLEPSQKLSEFTCSELTRIEELIVAYRTRSFTKEEVIKEIEALRVFNRFPVFSFDDFNQLKNYNQEVNKVGNLQRLQRSSNSLSLMLNNLTSLVQVKLDSKLENYVIKELVKSKDEDVFSFVSYGTGILADWIFTAALVDNSVQILEADSGNLIFKITLESEESLIKNCVNIDKTLYLLLEGGIIEAYNIETNSLIWRKDFTEEIAKEDFIIQLQVSDGELVLHSQEAVFLGTGLDSTFGKVQIEVLKDKKLFPKIKKSGQYLVIAGIESSSFTLFDLKESKEITTVIFEDNIVLDFDLCKETNEIGLLLKSTSINESKPKHEEKSVQLRAITPQGFQVIEILETFAEAETLCFLAKPNLLLVEGNQRFELFNIFDQELGKGVSDNLVKKLDEEIVSPSLNGPYEFSTKEQSEGSAPLKDIGLKLHQNYFNVVEDQQLITIQINLQVGQANEATFQELLVTDPTVLQPLVDLIRSKAGVVKDQIMNELREEIRKEEQDRFDERIRKCLADERINILNEIQERYPQLKKL